MEWKTIRYRVNYGGYIGADDEYGVEVPADATEDEIDDIVEKDFEDQIRENCSYEILGEDGEDDD